MALRQVLNFGDWLRRHPTVLSVVLGTVGVLLIVVGVLGAVSSTHDLAQVRELRAGDGTTVTGTLNGSEPGVDKNGKRRDRVTFCPRYVYTASDGVERSITDRDSCASSESQIEDKTVSILVDLDDPSAAFIDDPEASTGRVAFAIFAWSTLALGVGLVAACPIVAVRARRNRLVRVNDAPKH